MLVVWTARSVSSQWVHGEANLALEGERIIPVLLDREAQIPPPFNARSQANLFDWAGDESPDFQAIWASVRDLVQRGSKPRTSLNEWVIQEAVYGSSQLRSPAGRFRSINEVLLANTPAVQDLRDALEEVMNTYRVVMNGVQQFTKSAVKPGPFNGEPYVELAWSDLAVKCAERKTVQQRITGSISKLNGWLRKMSKQPHPGLRLATRHEAPFHRPRILSNLGPGALKPVLTVPDPEPRPGEDRELWHRQDSIFRQQWTER